MESTSLPASIEVAAFENITHLLEERVAQTPERILFSIPQEDNSWQHVTAASFHGQVKSLAKGFIATGIGPGERIAFICKTRYEWTLIDFALFYAGAIMVPVYETSSASQIEWILNNSGASAIVIENDTLKAKFQEVADAVPSIKQVWEMDKNALAELVEIGQSVHDQELETRRLSAGADDTATIIYTSGSFGKPKGCVLTHRNFIGLCRNIRVDIPEIIDQQGSATLLFITLAHVFARLISILAVYGGVRVGHAAPSKLLPLVGTFKPTFLLAVPRVFEKIYNGAEQKAELASKGKIFRAAARVAVSHSIALDNGHVPFLMKLRFMLFDFLVFSKLRKLLGGRVRYAVSGSAPLSSYLGHFYRSLGVKILEGYGLTETTAPLSVNLPHKFKIGTVGPVLPGTSVRIAPDGELLVKGIGVFKEYWRDPELTAKSFTSDGYFHTGDHAVIDSDGYIKITGRKKEIIVTAGGKNIAPTVLEDPLRAHPVIGQAVVVGEKRPFIGALITLDAEMLPLWLKNHDEDPGMSLAEAAQNPTVRAGVQRAIDRANKSVSRAESIRKFTILPLEFTEASGHLTPKLSIKRENILRDFEADITALYGGEAPQQ
ncbi:long-chain fatty acid--CoA ligase [Canibacter sp. lx-45]|uniref:AMP-dependent synthetase/ligase n=1 Tax=Canibacter zhuwentaonis TaxID=2837491 RepID=UPI001BDCC67D|nr:long-chain fatty acid--CoA ligase [Canibacter zhuwentaonis]MBT1035243.1 long-chain fatty acid--CoA ligase [Canibacter zhuwentaonis]